MTDHEPGVDAKDRRGNETEPSPFGRFPRLAHVLFWTAVFYLLAVGVARLAEWLSSQ